MGKSRYALAALALSASVVTMSAAQASVTVTVWGGADASNNYTSNINNHTDSDASGPPPTGTMTASFTWSGPVDWTDNSGNNGGDVTGNLFSEFFFTNGGTAADISDFTSGVGLSEASFLALSMSDLNSTYYSYIWVTGTAGAGAGTIDHDDGASVYQPAQGTACIYCSPKETVDIPGSFTTVAGAYQVAYIEANGSPSDLDLSVAGVPEASTWAMMLAGFGALGFAAFRRTRRARIAIV